MPWCKPYVQNVNMNYLNINTVHVFLWVFFLFPPRYSFYRFTSKYFFLFNSSFSKRIHYQKKKIFIICIFPFLTMPWRTVAALLCHVVLWWHRCFCIELRFLYVSSRLLEILLKWWDFMAFYILLDSKTNVYLGLKQSSIVGKTKLASLQHSCFSEYAVKCVGFPASTFLFIGSWKNPFLFLLICLYIQLREPYTI